jgi:hypothetical protein
MKLGVVSVSTPMLNPFFLFLLITSAVILTVSPLVGALHVRLALELHEGITPRLALVIGRDPATDGPRMNEPMTPTNATGFR